jgi:hypothetical protein
MPGLKEGDIVNLIGSPEYKPIPVSDTEFTTENILLPSFLM